MSVGTGNSRNILAPKVAAHSAAFTGIVGAALTGALMWASTSDKITQVDSRGPAVGVGVVALFVCLFMFSILIDAKDCTMNASGSEEADPNASAPAAPAAAAPTETKSKNELATVWVSLISVILGILGAGFFYQKNDPMKASWVVMLSLGVAGGLMAIFSNTGMSDCDNSAKGAEIFAGSAAMSGVAGTLAAVCAATLAFIAYRLNDPAKGGVSNKVWAGAAFTAVTGAIAAVIATQDLEKEEGFEEPMAIAVVSMLVLTCAGPIVSKLADMKWGLNDDTRMKRGAGVSAILAAISAVLAFVQTDKINKASQ